MKLHVPTTPPEVAVQGKHEANLIRWLSDPRGKKFFGHAFRLRADVLVACLTGTPLAGVAREHKVTPEAAYKYARRARALYPELHNGKLT